MVIICRDHVHCFWCGYFTPPVDLWNIPTQKHFSWSAQSDHSITCSCYNIKISRRVEEKWSDNNLITIYLNISNDNTSTLYQTGSKLCKVDTRFELLLYNTQTLFCKVTKSCSKFNTEFVMKILQFTLEVLHHILYLWMPD